MRRVPIKSGGFVYICEPGEARPPGEACFTADEFEWTKKLAQGYRHDPEQVATFWENIILQKRSTPTYNVFEQFPKTDEPVVSERAATAIHYCKQILETISTALEKKEGKTPS
jgi:hypothetical protein